MPGLRLVHYGITQGTSEGVFSPSNGITRSQMALFMVRAAGVAGAELDDPEDQGLGDIGGWTDAIQDAINQAVGAGIMSGSDGAFNPTGSVSRQEMAVTLRAFIDVVQGDDYYDVSEDDQDAPFSDLGTVPFAAYNAINELYELGIAAGTGDGSTFTPAALVSRAQMARFVTNALGHTNARPAGLSMQAEATGETGTEHPVDISVRDEDHQPIPDAVVDVFWSSNPDEAWNDDGTCNDNKNVDGNEACVINDDDSATDPDGNIEAAGVQLPNDPGSVTVWVWTGDVDDEFDIAETDFVTMDIAAELAASSTKLSSDMKEHADVLKFGDTVTFTLQLENEKEEPVASEGSEVSITAEMEDTTPLPDDAPSADDGTGELRPDSETIKGTHETDAAGRIEVSYTAVDPDPDEDNQDMITLTLTLVEGDGTPDIDATDADTNAAGQIVVTWVDNDSVETTLALDQSVAYHEADEDGARNTVKATLVDQYGDPIRSKKVGFWSMDTDTSDVTGLSSEQADPEERTTSRSGVATKSYTRSGGAGTETIHAVYVRGDCNDAQIFVAAVPEDKMEEVAACDEENDDDLATTDLRADTDDATEDAIEGLAHYWAASAVPASGAVDTSLSAAVILVVDTDNNVIVVQESGQQPVWVPYKADDFLTIVDGANEVRADLEGFEAELDVKDTVAASIGDDEDDRNSVTVTNTNTN